MQPNYPSPVLDFTLRYEGGWADNPRDPGGATMDGITQSTYDAYRSGAGLPKQSVRSIGAAERDAIYRDQYWGKIGGDKLSDGVDLVVFDLAVNSGASRAKSLLAAVGAVIDPVTAVQAICAKRLSFLQALKSWGSFGRGWGVRDAACEALGVKMALQARYGAAGSGPASAGIARQLDRHGAIAKAKASRSRVAAGATATAGSLAGGTQLPGAASAAHLPAAVLILFGLILVVILAVLAWQAAKHDARATAYAAQAKAS